METRTLQREKSQIFIPLHLNDLFLVRSLFFRSPGSNVFDL